MAGPSALPRRRSSLGVRWNTDSMTSSNRRRLRKPASCATWVIGQAVAASSRGARGERRDAGPAGGGGRQNRRRARGPRAAERGRGAGETAGGAGALPGDPPSELVDRRLVEDAA